MEITDTQILSYYYKGIVPSLPGKPIHISSITASEFLLIQTEKSIQANYYPILPSRLHHIGGNLVDGVPFVPRITFDSAKHAARGKHRTDQLLLNFGTMAPGIIEYGSMAIRRRPKTTESHEVTRCGFLVRGIPVRAGAR